MWTVGIDVGGAVMDLFAKRIDANEVGTAKVLTTPADRVGGVVTAAVDVDAPGQAKACGSWAIGRSCNAQFVAVSEMGDSALKRGPVR